MVPWRGRTNSHVAAVNKMVCNYLLDCVATGALVQRKEILIEESTKIRPFTMGWIWVDGGKSGGY